MLGALQLAAEVDLNPFKPEFGLYVWVSIAFLVVFVLLGKKVFPKLEETLADREHRIKASLEEAEDAKRQAEKLLEEALEVARSQQRTLLVEQGERLRAQLLSIKEK